MSLWPTDPLVLTLSPPAGGAAHAHHAAARVDAALAAWSAVLDTAAPPPRRRVMCVLRDDLVRFRVVAWNEHLHSPAARQALARQYFVEAFGEAARGWDVQIDAARYGRASLACAIDTRLLSGLGTELSARGLRPAGVQPALVWAFNHERRQLPSRSAWFVLPHDAGQTLLLVQGDEPVHVKQHAGMAMAPGGLAALIERESFALGLEGTPPPLRMALPQVHGT